MSPHDTYAASSEAGRQALRHQATVEALAHFTRACARARTAEEAAEAWQRVGLAEALMGHLRGAEQAYATALRYAAGLPAALAQIHQHQGTLRWLQGDLVAARSLLESAEAD